MNNQLKTMIFMEKKKLEILLAGIRKKSTLPKEGQKGFQKANEGVNLPPHNNGKSRDKASKNTFLVRFDTILVPII